MDSSIISIIVAVIIVGVISMAEKWINRPASDAPVAPPKRHIQPQQRAAAPPHKGAPQRQNVPKAPKPMPAPRPEHQPRVHQSEAFVEGTRVTSDAPQPRHPAPRPARTLPPMPGGNLRSAIIWGEILRRKF